MQTAISVLEDLARTDPVAAPLALLRAEAVRASADSRWEDAIPELRPGTLEDARPILSGANFTISKELARDLLGRLSVIACSSVSGRVVTIPVLPDALDLLKASVNQDVEGLERLAAETETESGTLGVLGELVASPLLLACGRKAEPLLRGIRWEHGYCPVCAAWPALAEVRGNERERWLRCGRCGTAWRLSHLKCAFCGNDNHETQGYLAPEASMEAKRATTCERCHGYLKSVSSMIGMDVGEVLLSDLSTLELDAAALERGYGRPGEPAYRLGVDVVPG